MKPQQSQPADRPEPPRRPEAVRLRARRSPRLIALGALAVALGALGAAALYSTNTDRVPVVAMAADVSRGEIVGPESLTTVEIPAALADGALAPAEADRLIGQPARSDLPRGSYPKPDHVGAAALPPGEVLVGLRLPLGRLPVTTMPPGTRVRLVGLADDFHADAVVTTLPAQLADGETYVFDVRVRGELADALARLSATDQVSLVLTEEA